jgi:Zn-dependent alcohol dehydrogenase
LRVALDDASSQSPKKVGAHHIVKAKHNENPAMALFGITKGGAHVSVDVVGIETIRRINCKPA